MGKVTVLKTTTLKPITLMGERAGICWGADISDSEKNYRRGLDCIESGHGRVMEYVNVELLLDGYSARVMREWYTHIGGAPTRLQASTRYIDYGEFEYVTPESIKALLDEHDEAYHEYNMHMKETGEFITRLVNEYSVPREDAALLLPLGMTTRVVDKRNLRNLVDMSRQRMCQRAYWEFRDLFDDISVALSDYSLEWQTIVSTQFYPKCFDTETCPEKHGCGKYPHANER